MGKAIYDMIRENLDRDGRLPEGFVLPGEDAGASRWERFVTWLWGVGGVFIFWRPKKDGFFKENRVMARYYMNEGMEKRTAEKIARVIRLDLDRGSDSREKIDARLRGYKYDTSSLIDWVVGFLEEDWPRLEGYARSLALHSSRLELVKLGIALLGLTYSGDPVVHQAVATLGLCTALTRRVCLAVSFWKDTRGNDAAFFIAQKLEGNWQKSDGFLKRVVVGQLKPETEEIRRWMLCYGWNCCPPPRLRCAEDGDMIGALRQETLDDELYDGIAAIIDLLLVEIDRNGISSYEHAEEALSRYLHFAGRQCKTLRHLLYMLNLWDWFEVYCFQDSYGYEYEGEVKNLTLSNLDELWSLCAEIIHRPHWSGVIREALDSVDSDERERAREAATRLEALFYDPEEEDNHA